jgi:hypothetical protein
MPTTYAIPNGRTVMDATTFTANAGTNVISNVDKGTTGFKPDLVWTKSRTDAYSNELNDSVRGVTKVLVSNATNAESTDANGLLSFNSNGFTLGNNNGANYTNGSAGVAWQWQAGQGSNTTNTTGTITSTVSANATAGFSIATYTGNGSSGATFGHSLGVAPSMVIVKNRTDAGSQWIVFHSALGGTKFVYLDGTNEAQTASGAWNNTAPTSTLVTLGNSSYVNGSTKNYVAYCWAEIAGFSRFGSYTGNGSTDGPFVYLGFRPKFVMIKASSSVSFGNWVMKDTTRNPSNISDANLYANLSNAEDTTSTVYIDILSNGFKLRGTYDGINGNGSSYVYMAFAENPFKYANAR